MIFRHKYLASDLQGYEYEREARTVGELPYEYRRPALNQIADVLNVEYVWFGASIYHGWGYTKTQIKEHGDRPLFHLAGDNMPLSLLGTA